MTLGERIKMFREAANLTQQKLADEIGVAKSTITGYEKGNREPDVDKLALIGHTSVEMLSRYQHSRTADLRRITDAI